MYEICVCCLASDRKLYPINNTFWDIFHAITQNHVLPQTMITICWECKAFFKKFQTFKKKALHSLSLLQQYGNSSKIKQHQKFKSSLGTRCIEIVDNMTPNQSQKQTEELIDNIRTEYPDIPTDSHVEFITPDIDKTKIYSPQIDSNKLNTPLINSIRLNTPEINGIALNIPQINSVELNTPQINSVELNTPQKNSIRLNTPQINIRLNNPLINSVRLDTPQINSIRLNNSQINNFRLNTPQISGIGMITPVGLNALQTNSMGSNILEANRLTLHASQINSLMLNSSENNCAGLNCASQVNLGSNFIPVVIMPMNNQIDQGVEVAQTSKIKVEEPDCIVDCIIENPKHHKDDDDTTCSAEDLKDPLLSQEANPGDYFEVQLERNIQNDHQAKWMYVLVDDQQLQEWRNQDENDSRYMRLYNKCTTCLMAFRFKDQLQIHNMRHHQESLGPHICDICQRRFPEEAIMIEHRQDHYMQYICLVCQFKCRNYINLKKHLIDEHTEATLKCDLCDEVFKTRSRLKSHKYTHKDKMKCKQCEKMVAASNVYTHMIVKHGNLPKAQCPICKKIYKNKYGLRTHMKTHEENKETFHCELCNIYFKNAYIYKNHFKSSLKHFKPEELEHECEECGRRFITAKRRQAHYDSVHLKKGLHSCDKCPKSYLSPRALRIHVSRKHEGTYVEPPRDKICDYCGRGFMTLNILRAHINTHTGERPYKCKLCPSTFGHSAALYTHNKLVHEKVKWKYSKKKNATRKGQKKKNEKTENR